MENSLRHHGVKGQKWGIRRYQNKDGTLTDAGMRRLGQISDKKKKVSFDEESGKIENKSSNLRKAKSAIHQNVIKDYKEVSNIADSGGKMARSASNIASRSAKDARKREMRKLDISEMTNKEIQDSINRMNLERTYKSLSTENVASGREYVSSILSTAGDVLAIGTSIASIMVAIHTIKS